MLTQNYKFQEKNVSTSQEYQQELMKLGARGVPSFLIDGELVVGFNKDKIESLVNYKIVSCPKCDQKIRAPKNKGKIQISCKNCETKFIINT